MARRATPTVGFTYGTNASQYNNGRLITMTDGLGSENYSYNNLGEITQVQKVVSGTTYTTSYGYSAGELTSITYPSGRVVNQNYDAIGRLAKVFDSANTYASNLGYNAASELTGLTYGNGVTATMGYSADRLQLTSLAYAKGTSTLFSLTYGYAAAGSNNGQIQGVTDNVDSGRTVSYSYDNLARLNSAVTNGDTAYPKWGLSFSYDRYGNRTAQTVTAGSAPSNSVTIDQTTNHISQSPYAYDANGNMTNDGLNSSMVHDAENRLVSINSGSATYSYDGKSLRVKKVASGTTTVYIFSGTQVIDEYQNGAAPSSPTNEYIYAGSQKIALLSGGSLAAYYHWDQLSIRLRTDTSGNTLDQGGHYPFGETWYLAPYGAPLVFTTYYRDTESGNDYATFRYDVNRLGRFASPDLLAGSPADPQSLNRYAYVLNDPVSHVDPVGLDCNWTNPDEPCNGGSGDAAPAFSDWSITGLDSGFLVDGFIPVSASLAGNLLQSGAGLVCPESGCPGQNGPGAGQTFVQANGDILVYLPSSTVTTGAGTNSTGPTASVSEPASWMTVGQLLADPFGTRAGAAAPPTLPGHQGGDVPLNPFARAVFTQVYRATAPLTNPQFYAVFYGASVAMPVTLGTTSAGAELFPALASAELEGYVAVTDQVPGGAGTVLQFVSGASSPAMPLGAGTSAWLGYLFGGLVSH